MVTEIQYKKALIIVAKYNEQLRCERLNIVAMEKKGEIELLKNKNESICEFPISVRLFNCLKSYFHRKNNDPKYLDVLNIDINDFANYRGIGKSAIKELKEIFY
jgi:DNA-directed RNA polymerase alpha subunit